MIRGPSANEPGERGQPSTCPKLASGFVFLRFLLSRFLLGILNIKRIYRVVVVVVVVSVVVVLSMIEFKELGLVDF